MGADDVAKMCELAVAFLSEKINEIFRKIEIGLYGYNFLSIDKSGTRFKKIKTNLQKFVKEYDLEISVKSNQKIVNYLDVTLEPILDQMTKRSAYIQNPNTCLILLKNY